MLSPGIVLQQRYRIKRLLARGGMGAVYEAEDGRLRNATVAVKETFFNEDRKNLREQFEREAATLARLRHPALPQVKDHFIEGGGQFLVMDFIAGDDLGALLEQRLKEKGEPFGFRQVMEWADRLLDTLDYIHGQNPPVIHRDIKPQNLKLTPRGELFLIDFGLAKDATTTMRPGHSVHAYTLEFAPPEQIKGEGADARSDLYSLGATLYHLITGELPLDARIREEAVVRRLMPDLLKPAHHVNRWVPFAFSAALAKAMALDREHRYQSAREMWYAVMGGNPSYNKGYDLPVENVSWDEAKDFCRRLSQMTGVEYRLPTEAEWEYACRAGTDIAYAGDLDAMAWYDKNSDSKTHPVGRKQPNAFGLYDMHGNVWEWCEDDWHGRYAEAPIEGSAWVDMPSRAPLRVGRGGGWGGSAALCRSANRGDGAPGYRDGYLGLRLSRTYR